MEIEGFNIVFDRESEFKFYFRMRVGGFSFWRAFGLQFDLRSDRKMEIQTQPKIANANTAVRKYLQNDSARKNSPEP